MLVAPEINDDYEHDDASLDYVLENVLLSHETFTSECFEFQTLQGQYNSILLNQCHCHQEDNCSNCCHGGNYVIDSQKAELVLKEGLQRDLIYECSSQCKCNFKCYNKLVQNGPRKYLKIINSTVYNSKGVITLKDIPKGAFICEYAGELLTRMEARRRALKNESETKMNYILCLNEIKSEDVDNQRYCISTIVDPSVRGNIGRYLNHSCAPNCEVYSVRVDCPIPKIAIFAKRNIQAGEELCFHYSGGQKTEKKAYETNFSETPCLCGSENCEKYLPNIKF